MLGWSIETGDLDALTAAVERLIAGAELRQSLGTAARRRVAEHFNPRKSFEKLLGIYQSALGHSTDAQALLGPTCQTGPAGTSDPQRIPA